MLYRTLVLAAVLTGTACSSKTYEAASLSGGEQLTYMIETPGGMMTSTTLTLERDGSTVILKTTSAAYGPQRLGLDLHDGRTPIKAFDLGMIWLPPSLRSVGSKTLLGNVVKEEVIDGRSVYVVNERNGSVFRKFDRDTGFLILLQRNENTGISQSARLQSSTIAGL